MRNTTPTTVRFGDWSALADDARTVRYEVFVQEQGVPSALEMDDKDVDCLHAVAYDAAGMPLGTGRLLPDGHIGRMAVRRPGRGTGIGSALLQGLMAQARERGHDHVALSAQTHAAPFYARHGFVISGAQFVEAGIAHVHMQYRFD